MSNAASVVRRVLRLAVSLCALSTVAHAGLFPAYPTGSGPGVWEVDRYAPAGFDNAGSLFGRADVLGISLSASDGPGNRAPAYSSSFYNTQGRGIQQDLASYSVLYGSVYLPASWAAGNPGNATLNRRADLWGVLSPATGGDVCPGSGCNLFPIIGFTNASASDPLNAGAAGRLRVFDTNIGFLDLVTPITYDAWTDVCIAFPGTELRFYVNGAQVYVQSSLAQADPSYGPPVKWSRAITQAYNFGSSYTGNWSNLGGGRLAGSAASGGNNQSAPVGTAFSNPLSVLVTDTGGAPLPCVPVTFAAPGAGASAALSATTVVTNMQGIAQVTATANATVGTYVVSATAPGLSAVSFNLANLGAAAAIAVNGGAGQSTPVTTAFGAPLSAQVTDGGGAPVAGATVTFTLPASGPSATFPGNALAASASPNAAGVATSPTLTANALVGAYAASATVAGVQGAAQFPLANTVVAATLAKSFAPSSIAAGETSTLTLALGNANPVPLTLASAFSDPMPPGLFTTGSHTGTCPGVSVGPSSIEMAAGALIAPGGCTIVVAVSSIVSGSRVNVTQALATDGGTTPAATATLVVTAAPAGPTLAKSFSPSTIALGGSSTLTLSLGNPSSVAMILTAALVDTFPAGMTASGAAGGTCAGAQLAPGAITLPAGATIPPGGCTIVASVTSSVAGASVTTTGTLVTAAGTAPPASATLTSTLAKPTLTKAFSPASIAAGGTSAVVIAIGNGNAVPVTLASSFVDTLPAGLATTSASTGTCAGVVVNATSMSLPAGASIPAGGCTIVVAVTAASQGEYVNVTGALATSAGSADPATAHFTVAAVAYAVAATGGGGQATHVGTAFGSALVATVTAGGAPARAWRSPSRSRRRAPPGRSRTARPSRPWRPTHRAWPRRPR